MDIAHRRFGAPASEQPDGVMWRLLTANRTELVGHGYRRHRAGGRARARGKD